MNPQLDLFQLSRRRDPETSKLAAVYVHPHLPRLQSIVFEWARTAGRFTDKTLVAEMQALHGGSESTWRTRRNELVRAELIVETGRIGKGKRMSLWAVKQ